MKQLLLVLCLVVFPSVALAATTCPNTWEPQYSVVCLDPAFPYACGFETNGNPSCKASLPAAPACNGGTVDINCNTCSASCVCSGTNILCSGACQQPIVTPACTTAHKNTDPCTGSCTACTSGYQDNGSGVCVVAPSNYILASPATPQAANIKINSYITAAQMGIGATSLSKLFEVSDSAQTDVTTQVRITDSSGNQNPEIQLQYLNTDDKYHWGINASPTGGSNASFNIWGPNVNANPLGDYALTIRNDGNVGINATNPQTRLEVAGDVSSTRFCLKGACKADWNEVAGTSYWTLVGNNLYASILGNNVGIGTATPGAKFVVANGWTNLDNLSIKSVDSYGAGLYVEKGDIIIQNGRGLSTGVVTSTKYCIGASCITNWSQAGTASQWTTNNGNIYNNNAGNVGIGTMTPTSKLEIQAASGHAYEGALTMSFNDSLLGRVKGRIMDGNNNLIISNNLIRVAGNNPFWSRDVATDNAQAIILNSNGGSSYMQFVVGAANEADSSGLPSTRMIIRSDGNVGIGTTTPNAKLTVSGGWTNLDNLSIKSVDSYGAGLYVEKGDIVIQNGRGLSTGVVTSTKYCIGTTCIADWSQAGTSSQWTTDNGNIYYNGGNVGIGAATLVSNVKLQIYPTSAQEGLRITLVQNSNISPLSIKSWSGADLFRVDATGIIQEGKLPWSHILSFLGTCPDGQFLRGFDNTQLYCTAPVSFNDLTCDSVHAGQIKYVIVSNVGIFRGCRKTATGNYEWVQLNN